MLKLVRLVILTERKILPFLFKFTSILFGSLAKANLIIHGIQTEIRRASCKVRRLCQALRDTEEKIFVLKLHTEIALLIKIKTLQVSIFLAKISRNSESCNWNNTFREKVS